MVLKTGVIISRMERGQKGNRDSFCGEVILTCSNRQTGPADRTHNILSCLLFVISQKPLRYVDPAYSAFEMCNWIQECYHIRCKKHSVAAAAAGMGTTSLIQGHFRHMDIERMACTEYKYILRRKCG
jgi:hypothetical protein